MPDSSPSVAAGDEQDSLATLHAWFERRGWKAFPFQAEVWAAMAAGRSGLLHANTGSGKTYAAWLGAIGRAQTLASEKAGKGGKGGQRHGAAPALGVLWLTPMRALAADTQRALALPLAELAPDWTLGLRTGDTPSAERARQDKRWPSALVTTPESLSLLLTRANASQILAAVHTVVVDEWHELLGSKRGVQVQLALARLRQWRPDLVVWGLSATLGNLDEAMLGLLGPNSTGACLVRGRMDKTLTIDTLLPDAPERFTWAGQWGLRMLPAVAREVAAQSGTTLIFTNTRGQAEAWYQGLLDACPDWAGQMALHHGSLDREVRDWVEAQLREGRLKLVVATSSLDLGVDFSPVERVLQIGSAKAVARLLQRAGRSGHSPGRASRVTQVPTHLLELVEAAALRQAAEAGRVESRRSPHQPMDVLVQHLVTVALGGGFQTDALWDELRSTWAYRHLPREAFDWAMDFVCGGGQALAAYPEYHRVAWAEGAWRVPDAGIARRHRLQVGTIVSEAMMNVCWLSGGRLGTVEEGFVARLKVGDCFVFAGRVLEYVRTREMSAYVRKADKARGAITLWNGSRMAWSPELGESVRSLIDQAGRGEVDTPEMRAATPLLVAQARLSVLPAAGELLIEQFHSADGHHVFIYPMAGRRVHAGLAGVLAWRWAQLRPNTFSIAVNEFGLELLSAEPPHAEAVDAALWWTAEHLAQDLRASLNAGEMAQRRFREIARVAGLVFGGYPGQAKAARQLQASSSLFFEVFARYDPGNRLLAQADEEVLSEELDLERLARLLEELRGRSLRWVRLAAPSPLALPLMVDRMRERLSTESVAQRLQRMLDEAHHLLDEPLMTAEPPASALSDGPAPATSRRKARRPAGRRLRA